MTAHARALIRPAGAATFSPWEKGRAAPLTPLPGERGWAERRRSTGRRIERELDAYGCAIAPKLI